MTRPHPRPRRVLRIPGWYLGLFLMFVSAAISVAVLWALAAWYLSLAPYIPSQP